jgi:restriction system protein
MAIPTYDRFIEPILRYLAQHPDGARARDVSESAADALGVSPDDRTVLLPSGAQPIYKNRAGWAHDRLKRHGLSSSPRRGFWLITPAGLDFLARHPHPLTAVEIGRLAEVPPGSRANGMGETEATAQDPAQVPDAVASPDDRLNSALGELRDAAIGDLLETLAGVSPARFEGIVLDVLHRMGYGTERSDLKRIGGVGDGGVDGVISLDRLGLEKVYVQAKRWQAPVGRPEIQAFYGALAGQHAHKGVFMTISSYTTQALEFARTVEGIVLVDGARLAGLMIDHEVGVTLRWVYVPRLDGDYFDEDV